MVLVLAVLVSWGLAGEALGQAAPKAAAGKGPKKPVGDGAEVLEPVELMGGDLRTADGVVLHATFYPSTQGKTAVPIILLHGWKGDRREYADLATELPTAGHAVLVPDLRGHGESTEQRVGLSTRVLDGSRMESAQFARMVEFDMETLKKFLKQKNNAGELNLEKLCIVGSEMGALVAMNWAVLDWSWPIYPGLKQGQYVKALVLLSPQWSFRGLDAKTALASPAVRSQLSIYILAGREGPKVFTEAQRLHTSLERYHPAPPEEEALARKDLFIKGFETKFQGTKLLANPEVIQKILLFVDVRLAKRDFPWMDSSKKAAARE
jgi:pimeloyl-ACP methyl ester carboxylesterase